MKQFLRLISLFFTVSLVSREPEKPCNATMIIFVHGTVKPAEFSVSSIIKIMRDKVDNTLYSRALKYIRDDESFYNSQAMQRLGLHKIDMTNKIGVPTPRAVAEIYNLQYEHYDKKAEHNLYYTFGWSGLLSSTKRYEEAKIFYEQLTAEIERLNALNIYPEITIIAFSHGANVALNLAAVKNDFKELKKNAFIIENLVTLAAPVLRETDYLVNDSIFKNAYHLYSTEDNVQVWDMFSSKDFFPRRKFTHKANFDLDGKFREIRIRLTKKIKFRHTAKNIEYPYQILAEPRIRRVHKDPGHTEMWSFKWGSYWYRKASPLNPLPVMVFIPTILHTVKQYQDPQHMVFDYAPSEEGALLYYKPNRFKEALPLVENPLKKEIWKIAKKNKPKNYSVESQQERTALALQKAKEELLAEKQYHKPRHRILSNYMKNISKNKFAGTKPRGQINKFRLAQMGQ